MTLDDISKPEDLRKLTIKEKQELASEIRSYILENVSRTGGHVSSNLGVVELTIALHSVFKTPRDKVVWDVGHQTYTHKILTGRKNKFGTLRQLDGISGFPKTSESEYDNFNTGHSSTSISAALGIARARDLKKDKYKVIAVIGDGALTGGMALEALNDVGASNTNIIVIVNDNEMSISKNTGGLARALTKMRTRKFYTNSNKRIKNLVAEIPKIGGPIIKFVHICKHQIKRMILPNMMFEDIGFKYLGPVDGNDIEKLEALFRRAKDLSGPILIHCKTVKGKGYKPAELEPDRFHSIGKFDINTGLPIDKKEKDYSEVFGDSSLLPKKEGEEGEVISPYAATKKADEIYAKLFYKLYKLPTIGLRYFNVYGPKQDPNSIYSAVIPLFINKVIRDEAVIINGDGSTSRDFTYVEDVIQANIKACLCDEKYFGNVYNIAYGGRITLDGLYKIIVKKLNKNSIPIHGPNRVGDIKHSNASIYRAKKELGYHPRYNIKKGIYKTIKWYQKQRE
jgi:1-deoxy-D-xylulose-5-phosphate synthase